MTNNITDTDRAVAREIETYVSRDQWHRVKEFIAQHRIDAVSAREKEIVGVIKTALDWHEQNGSTGAAIALRAVLKRIQAPSEGAQA